MRVGGKILLIILTDLKGLQIMILKLFGVHAHIDVCVRSQVCLGGERHLMTPFSDGFSCFQPREHRFRKKKIRLLWQISKIATDVSIDPLKGTLSLLPVFSL